MRCMASPPFLPSIRQLPRANEPETAGNNHSHRTSHHTLPIDHYNPQEWSIAGYCMPSAFEFQLIGRRPGKSSLPPIGRSASLFQPHDPHHPRSCSNIHHLSRGPSDLYNRLDVEERPAVRVGITFGALGIDLASPSLITPMSAASKKGKSV